MHYLAIIRLHIGMQLAETGEIGIIKQSMGRLIHLPEIRLTEKPPCILTIERFFPSSYIIFISTISSIKASVRIIPHPFYSIHGNIGRKQTVQLIGYLLPIQFFFKVKMRHHKPGMHTGIRTSCSHHLYLFSQESRKRTHQRFLHTHTVGLDLPAMIICSVVSQIYKVSHFEI